MELQQLRYFLVAGSQEHISRAAEKLHIAQPALTQSIRRLESELGMELFSRKGRNIVLNDAGKVLMEKLPPILNAIDKLGEEIKRELGKMNSVIRLDVRAASSVIIKIIAEYKSIHKDVDFRIYQSGEEGEECDVTITTYRRVRSLGYNDVVFHEDIYLAVPRDSVYAERNGISLKSVAEEGYISLAGSRMLRTICDGLCEKAGFTPHIIFESDSPATVRDMIGANMGIGFWPAFSWGSIDTHNVALLPITYPESYREILITRRKRNAVVDGFYHYLIERFQDFSLAGKQGQSS